METATLVGFTTQIMIVVVRMEKAKCHDNPSNPSEDTGVSETEIMKHPQRDAVTCTLFDFSCPMNEPLPQLPLVHGHNSAMSSSSDH